MLFVFPIDAHIQIYNNVIVRGKKKKIAIICVNLQFKEKNLISFIYFIENYCQFVPQVQNCFLLCIKFKVGLYYVTRK